MRLTFSWALKIFVSLSIILLLVEKSDANFIFDKLKVIDKHFFLLSIFMLFTQTFLATIRFKSLVSRVAEVKISFLDVLKNYLSSYFIGIFFLGAIGFDFCRYIFLREKKIPTNKNLSILIFDRLLIAAFSFFIAYFGLTIFLYFYYPLYFPYFIFSFLITLFIVTFFYFFSFFRHFFFNRICKNIFFLFSNFRICFRGGYFYSFSLNILASSLLSAFSFYLLMLSLDLSISFFDCIYLSASLLLINALPISISGLGIREFYLVKILSLYNFSFNSALTFSFLYGISLFLIAIPGAFLVIFYFFQKKEFPFFGRFF